MPFFGSVENGRKYNRNHWLWNDGRSHPERASQHGVCLSTMPLRNDATQRARAAALAEKYGVHASVDNEKAVREASLVVLGVKPQMALDVLKTEALQRQLDQKVLISICAGLGLDQMNAVLPRTALIRAMPNTPCLIGEGMTVLAAGPRATDSHVAMAQGNFCGSGTHAHLGRKTFGCRHCALWEWPSLWLCNDGGAGGWWRNDGTSP